MHEMETLQRRMEELQRQYMKDKETYRLQLISSLLAARKTQVPWYLSVLSLGNQCRGSVLFEATFTSFFKDKKP
jgi:hypothetical protein